MSNSAPELLPLNTLLNCRTVVESQNFVSTGLLSHAEGELFEIEIREFDAFELGEKVKVTVYSPAGIQTFSSMVFAKYEGVISVIQPPQLQKRFVEKRAHPRVDVKGSLTISRIVTPQGEIKMLEEPLVASLRNISVSGVGFEAEYVPELERSARVDAVADVGFTFDCELVIARREKQSEKWMYGATLHVVEPEMMRPLRALILRLQVEKNIQARKIREFERKI